MAVGLATLRQRLEQLLPAVSVPKHSSRDPGRRPSPDADPFGALAWECTVVGADGGLLAGLRVVVKDNIAVAGIPMSEGRETVTTVPAEDATVVERLLAAGATIIGKSTVDDARPGCPPTKNPVDPYFVAGGSSGGSAAAVASGMAHIGIGVDQGGSIRQPAAWCAIVGMKPTHGLVPTYGLAYWDHTLDDIGPMTRTVEENARVLEVIAGDHSRGHGSGRARCDALSYRDALATGVRGTRIGVLREALVGCSDQNRAAFEDAIASLRRLGAEVRTISVPLWSDAGLIWLTRLCFGLHEMASPFGRGLGYPGRIDLSRFDELAGQISTGRRGLPVLHPFLTELYDEIMTTSGGREFAVAQNLRVELARQVDEVLSDLDVLVMPTTLSGPPPVARSAGNEPSGDPLTSILGGMTNTAPNLTGHPALTVPAGPGVHGMPTGLQLLGRRHAEATLFGVGFAFESEVLPHLRD